MSDGRLFTMLPIGEVEVMMRIAVCEECKAGLVTLNREQAVDLPTLQAPLLCVQCKGTPSEDHDILTVRVHALYECGDCGGVMLSTAEGIGVGTITVVQQCPICKEANMDLVSMLTDTEAEEWWL